MEEKDTFLVEDENGKAIEATEITRLKIKDTDLEYLIYAIDDENNINKSEEDKQVIIMAAKILKDHGENIRWYVLGEGDQHSRLTALIQKLGLEEDFKLLGATDNPYPYFKKADLYVHCSRFEGKSIAVQEAQILGKPIIVSDCSGNREQVNHGEDGLICEFNSKSIAKAIKELLDDKGLREKLAKNALKRNMNSGEEVKKIFEN